jgi:hypothetical protein
MAEIIKTENLQDRLKGDSFPAVTFVFDDGVNPTDLTGATILVQFRMTKKTGEVVKTLTDQSGITIATPTNGTIVFDRWEPIDWAVGKYFYDVQITFPDSRIKTPVQGHVMILQDTSNI